MSTEPLIIAEQGPHVAIERKRRRRARLALGICLLCGAVVCFTGITWGLPSRRADSYLFGDRPAWSGEKVLALTGQRGRDADRGADVDVNPLAAGGQILCLNETDQQRAEIVRRYRLFSYQPDEMVTMMALAQMRPGQGDLDPKLYQYGGLWIYPVGALLRVASLAGLVTVTSNLVYYLDCPEAIGRFYVVARLYVAVWTLVGTWTVFSIARRLTDGCLTAALAAAICFILMPVIVNMSHEAKPHLPGAILTLLTARAAMEYVRTATRRWLWAAVVLSGAAVGMVLAAWPAILIPPAAGLLIRQAWRHRVQDAALAVVGASVVYFIANPYVFLHLFDNRELLVSNLGNTRKMFAFSLESAALLNAMRLIVEGTSWLPAAAGAVAVVSLAIAAIARAGRRTELQRSPTEGWLLAVPAVVAVAQFVAFAAGQPDEYGRFAILIDAALMIAGVVGMRQLLALVHWPRIPLLVLPLGTVVPGVLYLDGFRDDASDSTTRLVAAKALSDLSARGARTLGVFAEPAPYAVPPVDLLQWRLLLLPKGYDPARDPSPPDVAVRVVDGVQPPDEGWISVYDADSIGASRLNCRMRWAAKPFVWMTRKELAGPPEQGMHHRAD